MVALEAREEAIVVTGALRQRTVLWSRQAGRMPQVMHEGQQNTQVPESFGGPIVNIQEVPEAHPSTHPATVDKPPSPCLFKVGYLISPPILPTSSPYHYTQFKSRISPTPLPLMEHPSPTF